MLEVSDDENGQVRRVTARSGCGHVPRRRPGATGRAPYTPGHAFGTMWGA